MLFFLQPLNGISQRIIGSGNLKSISGKYFDINIKIYRENEPNPPIIFEYGDGNKDTLIGNPVLIANTNIIATSYYGSHQYDSTGHYVVGFRDSFLVENVVNIPNSGNQSIFFSDSLYVIPDSLLITINQSPGIGGHIKGFNVNADGAIFHNMTTLESDQWDYYTCHLVPFPLPGYSMPEATDSLTCEGGLFIWDKPVAPGRYAFAMRLRETRQWPGFEGIPMGTNTRYVVVDIDSSMLNTTQIISFDLVDELKVYPIPANGELNISLENSFSSNKIQLSISNLLGQTMYQEQLFFPNKKIEHQIDVSSYPIGTYFLSLKSGAQIMTRKFIVSR